MPKIFKNIQKYFKNPLHPQKTSRMIHYIGWTRSTREKPAAKNRGLFCIVVSLFALAILTLLNLPD
jgi:hypothetical protein